MTMLPDIFVPPLTPRHVHVWRVSLEADAAAVAACCRLLAADERQRAGRFISQEHRRRFVVARAWLRQLLERYTGERAGALCFAYGSSGKPGLHGGGWHFNVSHSGELALIAVASGTEEDAAVGVDLEMIRPLDYDAVGRRVLAEEAMSALSRLPAAAKREAFFRLWVRHEAQVKAMGTGIGTRADVPVYDLDVGEEYRAAVATAVKDVRIEMFSR